jgi:hypothetical protein
VYNIGAKVQRFKIVTTWIVYMNYAHGGHIIVTYVSFNITFAPITI